MTRVVINPGVCGFTTIVEIEKIDKKRLACRIESECKTVAGLNEILAEIDKWDVLKPRAESKLWLKLSEHPLHLSCPVPVGIIKAVEAEAGLALARDVNIHFKAPEED